MGLTKGPSINYVHIFTCYLDPLSPFFVCNTQWKCIGVCVITLPNDDTLVFHVDQHVSVHVVCQGIHVRRVLVRGLEKRNEEKHYKASMKRRKLATSKCVCVGGGGGGERDRSGIFFFSSQDGIVDVFQPVLKGQ